MFASLLITFRETLEAALVVGVVLTFLTKTNQLSFKKFIWQGVGIGIVLSIVLAFLLQIFFSGFEGRAEEIFEGVLMFVTVGFLTWMIMWVHKQKDIAKNLKARVTAHTKKGYGIGIVILIAAAVFREGTETVLYLKASSVVGASYQLFGALLGILLALGLGVALFRFALRVNLHLVFTITNIFLLLFAAGLLAHGVHEFQEAGLLPVFSFDPVFTISHILDHESAFGSLLRAVFGYTSSPTFLEVFIYVFYILFILWLMQVTHTLLAAKQIKSSGSKSKDLRYAFYNPVLFAILGFLLLTNIFLMNKIFITDTLQANTVKQVNFVSSEKTK